jgi:hypothetical protein
MFVFRGKRDHMSRLYTVLLGALILGASGMVYACEMPVEGVRIASNGFDLDGPQRVLLTMDPMLEHARLEADRMRAEELEHPRSPFRYFVNALARRDIDFFTAVPFLDLTARGFTTVIDPAQWNEERAEGYVSLWYPETITDITLQDFVTLGSPFMWGHDGLGRLFLSFVYVREGFSELYIQTYFRVSASPLDAGSWRPAGTGRMGRNGGLNANDFLDAAMLLLNGYASTQLAGALDYVRLATVEQIKSTHGS